MTERHKHGPGNPMRHHHIIHHRRGLSQKALKFQSVSQQIIVVAAWQNQLLLHPFVAKEAQH